MDAGIEHIVKLAKSLTPAQGEDLLQRLELKLIGFSDEQIEKEIRGDAPLLLRETLSTAAERASEKAFAEIGRALERAPLSEEQLEELIARLRAAYCSEDEEEIDPAFRAELERRMKEFEEGRIVGIPWEEALAQLDAKYGLQKEEEFDGAWKFEYERRVKDWESGLVKAVPFKEAFRDLKQKLKL